MPTDIDQGLRQLAEELDAAASPITLDEIGAVGPSGLDGRADRRRVTLAAASVILMVGGAIGWAVVSGGDADTVRTPLSQPATTSVREPVPAASSSVPPTTTGPAPATSTDAADAGAGPVAPPDLSISELQTARSTALSALGIFSATVSTEGFMTPFGLQPLEVRSLTMDPDGSHFASGRDGSWSSFDAATGTIRARFFDPGSDTPRWSQTSGQSMGKFALAEAITLDPTAFVEEWDESARVRGTVRGGRPGWEVVTTFEQEAFERMTMDGAVDEVPSTTVTERRFVDEATGLLLEVRRTSSARPDEITAFVLTDLLLGGRLPPEFPGEVPNGETLDVNEGTEQVEPFDDVTAVDVANEFGIALPMPVLEGDVVVAYIESPAINTSEEVTGVLREVRFENRSGYVTRVVTIEASTVFDLGNLADGEAVIDGYRCADADGDGMCGLDPLEQVGPGLALLTVESGALSGADVSDAGDSLLVNSGPFLIDIRGAPDSELWEIVNSFELIVPQDR